MARSHSANVTTQTIVTSTLAIAVLNIILFALVRTTPCECEIPVSLLDRVAMTRTPPTQVAPLGNQEPAGCPACVCPTCDTSKQETPCPTCSTVSVGVMKELPPFETPQKTAATSQPLENGFTGQSNFGSEPWLKVPDLSDYPRTYVTNPLDSIVKEIAAVDPGFSKTLSSVLSGSGAPGKTILNYDLLIKINGVLFNHLGSGNGLRDGHSFRPQHPARMIYIAQSVQSPVTTTYCETGFNLGNSAFTVLATNPFVKVYSFDMVTKDGEGPKRKAVDFMRKTFAKRFTLIEGDSTKTIPKFAKENPSVKCDVVLVDGGHKGDIPIHDFRNFWLMAGTGATVIADDYEVSSGNTVAAGAVKAADQGLIQWTNCRRFGPGKIKKYCFGRYRTLV